MSTDRPKGGWDPFPTRFFLFGGVKSNWPGDYRGMNEITNNFNSPEDRTMTNTRISTLNENELKMTCGGADAKQGAGAWSMLDDDNGSVYTSSDTDPRFPIKV